MSNDLTFTEFVFKQATNAGVFLGQRENPLTGQKSVNLKAAKGAIDVLELIEVKTKGNLTPEETLLINKTLKTVKDLYDQTEELEPID